VTDFDPHSDPRTPGAPVSLAAMANRLYADAGQERQELMRLAALAKLRPDLAPLIEVLVMGCHRRSATATMLAGALPRIPAPPAPQGWWERVRVAWKVLFPGR
jgi:hypothetical protein